MGHWARERCGRPVCIVHTQSGRDPEMERWRVEGSTVLIVTHKIKSLSVSTQPSLALVRLVLLVI